MLVYGRSEIARPYIDVFQFHLGVLCGMLEHGSILLVRLDCAVGASNTSISAKQVYVYLSSHPQTQFFLWPHLLPVLCCQ
jgi:hypothetical protein